MLKRLLSVLLVLLIIPQIAFAALTEAEIYQQMLSLRGEFYEGRSWTNADYYGWKGGIYSGGYGCAGFAFRLSDEAFGSLQCRMVQSVSIDSVRVGDIIRINNNTHSVIVLEVYDDYVVVAEGNYNRSVHWGRTFDRFQLEDADYLLTRYPVNMATPTSGYCGDSLTWSYANGVLTIDGSGDMWDFKSVFGHGSMDPPWEPFMTAIHSIEFSEDITAIGYNAFEACTALVDVFYSGTTSDWSQVTINDLNSPLLKAELHATVIIPDGLLTAVLPDGIQVIEREAFAAVAFEVVKIPDSCKEIQSRAFADCPKLKYVCLSSKTTIAADAFAGCGDIVLIYTDK